MLNSRSVAPLLIAIFLGACTASEKIDSVEAEVAKFHALLDEGRFETIWYQGSTEFQKVVTREEFIEFLSAVHRKLGNVGSAKREGWGINYTQNGTVVTLSYKTSFAAGEAAEQFVYQNDGKLPQLLRYDISSRLLVVK